MDLPFQRPLFALSCCTAVLLALVGCTPDDGLSLEGIWQAASINDTPVEQYGVGGSSSLSPADLDGAQCVELVDFDGDGRLDVVLGGHEDGAQGIIEFWRQAERPGVDHELCFRLQTVDSSALPSPLGEPAPPVGLSDLAFADYDGDGDPDLLVAINGLDDQLWQNHFDATGCDETSEPHFTHMPTVLPPLPAATTSVAWGDWNGDGRSDLAVGVWGDTSYILTNRGHPPPGLARFEVSHEILLGPSDPEARKEVRKLLWGITERNGDPYLELAIAHEAGLAIFSPNDDGDEPIWWATRNGSVRALASADLDGDGKRELAAAWLGADSLSLYYGDDALSVAGPFQGSPDQSVDWPSDGPSGKDVLATGLAFADENLDGTLDLAAIFGNLDTALYRGQSHDDPIPFSLIPGWGVATQPSSDLAFGDGNHDGPPELLITASWGPDPVPLTVLGNELLGPQRETFFTANCGFCPDPLDCNCTPPTPPHYSVAVADYDQDGDLDLAVGETWSSCSECNFIWVNTLGNFSAPGAFVRGQALGPGDFKALAWGDVDGDGDLDLAVGFDGGGNRIYLNSGSPSFELTSNNPWTDVLGVLQDNTRGLAWGDIDADGDLDLAVANHSITFDWGDNSTWPDCQNRVWRNTGTTFEPLWEEAVGLPLNRPEYSNDVAWGDWDNDGDLDLAFANGPWDGEEDFQDNPLGAEHSQVYRNDLGDPNEGTELLAAPQQFVQEHRAYSVAWGDANEDGLLDLALGYWGEENELLFNLGNPTGSNGFESHAVPERIGEGQSRQTTELVWADFDLDGDLDLAESNWAGPNLVHLNKKADHPVENTFWGSIDFQEIYVGDETAQRDTKKIAWLDYDNDGDQDLISIEYEGDLSLYKNNIRSRATLSNGTSYGLVGRPTLLLAGDGLSPGLHCVGPEGDPEPAFPGPGTTLIAESCRILRSHSQVVAVPVILFDPEDDPVSVRLEFSRQGGGLWLPATTEGYLGKMKALRDGQRHEIKWLIGVDPVFGDRVRLRLVVDRQTPVTIPGSALVGRQYSVSEPFRVVTPCAPKVDGDQDGWPCLEDCDDTRPDINPDQAEDFGDEVDQDCDGFLRECVLDRDGDTWGDDSGVRIGSLDGDCEDPHESYCGANTSGLFGEDDPDCEGFDCDDYDPEVMPGISDTPGDGIDSDCDGSDGGPGDDDDTGDDDDDDTGDDDTGDDDAGDDDDDSCLAEDCYVQPPGCEFECGMSARRASSGSPLLLLLLLAAWSHLRRRRSLSGPGGRASGSALWLGGLALGCVLLVTAGEVAAQEPDVAAPGEPPPAESTEDAEQDLEDASKVAIEALAVHDEHCASMAGIRIEKADAMVAVAPVWKKVTESYQRTGASYLLYWRGMLELCLNMKGDAIDDLEAFLKEEGENPEFTGLARDARRRLRRLTRGNSSGLARGRSSVKGTGKAAARRAKWGPPVMIGVGAGGQGLLTAGGEEHEQFAYAALAVDVSVRIAGPLRFELTVNPTVSGPARNSELEDNGFHSLLLLFGFGPVLQFESKVRPRVGIVLQVAPNPDGDQGSDSAVGGLALVAGLDIPFGASPLSLRMGGAWGGLSGDLALARGLFQLVFSP